MTKNILISGIGVAGPTLAYWLAKHGCRVTMIERAQELRLGGQNIDISDVARNVVAKMGIKSEIEARHTGEEGLQFVDTDNNATASFPVEKKGSLTREIEILRGELIDASVNFLSDESDPDYMTPDDKKDELRKCLDGAGWESARLADALTDVDDIFLGPLHQIKADRWSKGRCVLAGDAAHCPTPYTGMGTTLAILGAYILANEIAAHDDHNDFDLPAYDDPAGASWKSARRLDLIVCGPSILQ